MNEEVIYNKQVFNELIDGMQYGIIGKLTKVGNQIIYKGVSDLQQENTQLKQQLKDKDEKISKVKDLLEEASLSSLSPFELFKIEEELLETLESNKED